jgi:hypothetical protein
MLDITLIILHTTLIILHITLIILHFYLISCPERQGMFPPYFRALFSFRIRVRLIQCAFSPFHTAVNHISPSMPSKCRCMIKISM